MKTTNEIKQDIRSYILMCLQDESETLQDCIAYAYNKISDMPEDAIGWTKSQVDEVAQELYAEFPEQAPKKEPEIVVINARRNAYSERDAAADSMTVQELRDLLSNYDSNARIVLCHDGGYSFGNLTEECIK